MRSDARAERLDPDGRGARHLQVAVFVVVVVQFLVYLVVYSLLVFLLMLLFAMLMSSWGKARARRSEPRSPDARSRGDVYVA